MSFAGGPSGAHNSCDIQDQDQDRELIDFSPRASLDQPQVQQTTTDPGQTEPQSCLTSLSGTRALEPTARELEHAASAPTKPVSSASTASTSADNASVRKQPTLVSSSTASPSYPNTVEDEDQSSTRSFLLHQNNFKLRTWLVKGRRGSTWQKIKDRTPRLVYQILRFLKKLARMAWHGVTAFMDWVIKHTCHYDPMTMEQLSIDGEPVWNAEIVTPTQFS